MGERRLPFVVGQHVETQSFQEGYRGSWFKCKIRKISTKNGAIGHVWEYTDFPDQKIRWSKIFQKVIYGSKGERPRHLMVRPQFPHFCKESEMPDNNVTSDVVVVVNDVWKVGDLVDWWSDSCYWSGTITKLLHDGKYQVDLLPRPIGEGCSYVACDEDLRPSLDWSPENGWMVPVNKDGGTCARLIRALNHGDRSSDSAVQPADKGPKNPPTTSTLLSVPKTSSPSRDLPATSSLSSRSGIANSETIEASITKLEELVIKVKWLKNILESQNSISDA